LAGQALGCGVGAEGTWLADWVEPWRMGEGKKMTVFENELLVENVCTFGWLLSQTPNKEKIFCKEVLEDIENCMYKNIFEKDVMQQYVYRMGATITKGKEGKFAKEYAAKENRIFRMAYLQSVLFNRANLNDKLSPDNIIRKREVYFDVTIDGRDRCISSIDFDFPNKKEYEKNVEKMLQNLKDDYIAGLKNGRFGAEAANRFTNLAAAESKTGSGASSQGEASM
jgi:hypothetical protein